MGGVDLPQYSRVDLNLDGIEDLVIFDRQGSRWLTFLAEGNDWIAAPSYADLPKVEHWAYLEIITEMEEKTFSRLF